MRRIAVLVVAIILAACAAGPDSNLSPGASSPGASPGDASAQQTDLATPEITPAPTPEPTATPEPTPITLAALADRLADPDPAVRLEALMAIPDISDPAALPFLVSASTDSDQQVALRAIDYLGVAKTPEATAALLSLVETVPDDSADFTVSQRFDAVVTSLNRVHLPAAVARLLELAKADGCPLTTPTVEDVPALATALGSKNALTQSQALACLVGLHDPATVPALIKAAGVADVDVRNSALSALGDAGDPAATAVLIKNLGNAKSVDAATSALSTLYDGNAGPLLPYLKAKATIKVYLPIIQIGQSGTEGVLATALSKFGDKIMAVDYLNCGSPALDKAARTWATNHGYKVYTSSTGGGAVSWGS